MSADVILGLVNLGAAGAVIIVVIVFVKYLERKDDKIGTSLENVVKSVNETKTEVSELRTEIATVVETTRNCPAPRGRKEHAW